MNGHTHSLRVRFPNVPSKIDVPLQQEDEENGSVEVDLFSLPDDPTELCTLLEMEQTPHIYWITIALAYIKNGKVDYAIEMITKGLDTPSIRDERTEAVPMQSCLLWLYLQKAREAVRSTMSVDDVKTKDQYLQLATGLLNNLARFDPQHPAYVMGRAVYSSLKAGISGSKQERQNNWDLASKMYDDSFMKSGKTNMFALMGKARIQFQKGKYEKALELYQEVLTKKPDMDPDPRVGIGMCFWALGHKDDAKMAWERVLELDPDSKVANLLLGVYHLSLTTTMSQEDENFSLNYKKAMNEYVQKAYKKDKSLPLACTMFASHFFSAGGMANVEMLGKKAIEYSDVTQISSDAYYLMGRKHQQMGDLEMARQCFVQCESVRDEGSYLPAKLSLGQIQILNKDFTGAKFIFENITKTHPKCIEAMTVLGTLYAEEVFQGSAIIGSNRDEKLIETEKKAVSYLEFVRNSWKDPKKHTQPNPALLLTLARLYEAEFPEKSNACLQQVADIEKESSDIAEPMLAPQLLNNMGVFQYSGGKWDEARELFQTALHNCVAMGTKDDTLDTDALATTLTFNLARLEEAAGNIDEACKLYEELLTRHSDYAEASMRLAYIALRKGGEEGPKRLEELMNIDDSNLDLCALYGWYLSKRPRKGPINLAEDREQRHYKRTLQNHDKHDKYSLTGMGNLHLLAAREMRRDTEADKDKRKKIYERAVEFFDKALQLDNKNAYAAQGVAIALVEDRKEYNAALQVFSRVKETLKDSSVYINLAHCLTEVKQYTRAIENYEVAIKQHHAGRDPWILTALGRVWLLKGKAEQSLQCLNNALDYAKQALRLAPEQPIYKFNVAFIQVQICALVHNLPQVRRTASDIQAALDGLDEAIQTFTDVAKAKNPPYPAADIEQRSIMGKNTTRRQLKGDLEIQTKYEEGNAAKIAEAKKLRDEDAAKRAAEIEQARVAQEERNKKVAEERRILQEQAREWAEKKAAAEDEIRRIEDDEEVGGEGKKAKRRKGPKESRGGDGTKSKRESKSKRSQKRQSDDSGAEDTGDGSAPATKKRKLGRGGKKFISDEIIVDSDEDMLSDANDHDDDDALSSRSATPASPSRSPSPARTAAASTTTPSQKPTKAIMDSDDEEDDNAPVSTNPAASKRSRVRRIDDEDEDEDADLGLTNDNDEIEQIRDAMDEDPKEVEDLPISAAAPVQDIGDIPQHEPNVDDDNRRG